ncbi:MAG: ComF family protein [Tepidiformaceae bacterium]
MLLRTAATRALGLLYPERCIDCGEFGTLLCVPCERKVEPATGVGRCRHCSARFDGTDNCPRCMSLQQLEGVRAAFEMDGAARHVVHALKYRGVRPFAQRMAEQVEPLRQATPFDVAFAVPLHRSRHRSRGFNQSKLILDALSWPTGQGSLHRMRKTETQVGLRAGERRSNVSGAFSYDGPSLTGLTVAILDDVVTTGATVNECAAVLREHGARAVYAFAYARASYNPATPLAEISD